MANGNNRIDFQIGFSADESGLKKLQANLTQIMEIGRKADPLKPLQEGEQDAINKAIILRDALQKAYNAELGTTNITKLNNELKKSGTSIDQCRNSFKNMGAEGANAYNLLGTQILGMNVKIKQTNKLLDKMAVTFANTVRFGISSSAYNNMTNAVQKAVRYAEDLDESLTAIRIVSGNSAENMEKFAKDANNAAKALGSTTLDYADASLIYYQQGLDDDEVKARTDVTIEMANVLGESASEVSNYMTAIWNNFDDGSKSLEYYGDVITALGASTASSAAEISEGLEKFAAVADTVGLSYEYATTALATVVAETRQSADVVGTAFKTLFARIQDLELGETLDDGTTLGKYSQALESVGINIKDQNGQLKEMDDILDEMGSKWNTLSKDTQVALAQTVAGTRQYTQLVALMDNWDKFGQNLQTASEATGTLQKQQDIYLQSTEAKLKTLKTTWQDLYGTLVNKDELNAGITAITELAATLDKMFASFGGGIKSIAGMGAILSGVFNQQINKGIISLSQGFKESATNADILATKLKQIQAGELKDFSGNTIEADSAQGLGYQANLQEQLSISKEIQAVQSAMSQEEYNQLTNKQVEVGLLAEQSARFQALVDQEAQSNLKIEEKKALQEEITNQLNDETQNLTLLEDKYLSLASASVSESEAIEQIIDDGDERIAQINELLADRDLYTTLLQEEQILNEESGKITAEEVEIQQSITDEEDAILNLIEEINNEYGITIKDVDKIIKGEKTVTEILKEQGKQAKINAETYTSGAKQAKNKNVSREKGNEAGIKKNDIQTTLEAVEANKSLADSITKVTTTASTLASTYMSITSIFDIVNNSEISVIDKIVQISLITGTTIPVLISNINKLKAALGAEGTILDALKAKKIAHNALTMQTAALEQREVALKALNTKEDKKLVGSIAAKVIAKQTDITATTEEGIAQELENIQKESNIVLSEEQCGAITAVVMAKKAETVSTEAETVAQNAMNASLLANPYVLIAMAIVGATALIVKSFTAQRQAALDAANAETQAAQEALNAHQEEVNKIRETADAYQDLKQSLNDGSISEQDFKDKAIEICKQLGLQSEIVKILAGDYNSLEDAIASAEEAANSQIMADAEDQKIKAEQSIKAGASVGTSTGYDIYKTIFGTSAGILTHVGRDIDTYDVLKGFSGDSEYITRGLNPFNANANASIEQELSDLLGDNYVQSDLGFSIMGMDDADTLVKVYDSINQVLADNAQYANSDEYKQLSQLAENMKEGAEAWKTALDAENGAKLNNKLIEQDFNENDTVDEIKAKRDEVLEYATSSIENDGLGLDLETANTLIDSYLSGLDGVKTKYQEILGLVGLKTAFNIDDAELEDTLSDLSEGTKKYLYLNFDKYKTLESAIEAAKNCEKAGDLKIHADLMVDSSSILSDIGDMQPGENFSDDINQKIQENSSLMDQITQKYGDFATFQKQDIEVKKALIEDFYLTEAQYIEQNNQAAMDVLNQQKEALQDKLDVYEENNAAYEETLTKDKEYVDLYAKLQEAGTKRNNAKEGTQAKEDAIAEYEEILDELNKRKDELKIEFGVEYNEEELEAQKASVEGQIDDLKEEIESVSHTDLAKYWKNEVAAASKSLDEIQSAFQSLNSVMEDYNKTEFLTMDNLQTLLAMDDKYLASLQFENGQLVMNTSAMEQMALAKLDAARVAAYEVAMEELEAAAQEESRDAAEEAAKQSYIASKAAQEGAEAARGAAAEWDAYWESVSGGKTGVSQEKKDEIGKALKTKLLAIDQVENQIKSGKFAETMGKSSSSSSSSEKQDKEHIDEQIDAYHQWEQQIKACENALSELQERQGHLKGKQLLKNIQAQTAALKEQAAAQERLNAQYRAEAAALRGVLAEKGAAFDGSGNISNYSALLQQAQDKYNATVDAYNKKKTDANEKAVDSAKKEYDNLKDAIGDYEKALEGMQKAQQAMNELMQKQADIALAELETKWEIEFQMDTHKAQRQLSDFINNLNDDFRKSFTDWEKEFKNAKDNFFNGGIQEDIFNQIKKIEEIQDFMDDTKSRSINEYAQHMIDTTTNPAGFDPTKEGEYTFSEGDIFTSASDASEYLVQLGDQLKDLADELKSAYETAWEAYLEGINQAIEETDRLNNIIDKNIDKLEQYRKIQQLSLTGADSTKNSLEFNKTLAKQYEAQVQGFITQKEKLESLLATTGVTLRKDATGAIDESSVDVLNMDEDQKIIYEQILNYQDKILDTTVKRVENEREILDLETKQTMNDLATQMFGSSDVDYLKQQWEDALKWEERYYNGYEQIYQIEQLGKKYDDLKHKELSLKAQEKINKAKAVELEELSKSENLSKDELAVAEKRLEVVQAEIALEEAQNNKNSMKLTRDETGNWSYQYVANEDDVAAKEQDLIDKTNEYYEKSKEAYQNGVEYAFEVWDTYSKKIIEIQQDSTISEEERQIRIQAVTDQMLKGFMTASTDVSKFQVDLATSAALLSKRVIEQNQIDIDNLSGVALAAAQASNDARVSDLQTTRGEMKNEESGMLDDMKEYLKDGTEFFDTTVSNGVSMWQEKESEITNSILNASNTVQTKISEYQYKVRDYAKAIGLDLGNVSKSYDEVANSTDTAKEAVRNYINEQTSKLMGVKSEIDRIKAAWDIVATACKNAASSMQSYIGQTQAAIRESNSLAESARKAASEIEKMNSTKNSNKSNSTDKGDKKYRAEWMGGTYADTRFNIYEGNKKVAITGVPNTAFKNCKTNEDYSKAAKQWLLNNSKYAGNISFKTGGYTGEWSNGSVENNGRLAMLHQKELVLNAKDTENMLDMVTMVREMQSASGAIDKAIINSIANMIGAITGVKVQSVGNTNSNNQNTSNTFNITAEFPNANDVNEIREAILSLPNLAQQYLSINTL